MAALTGNAINTSYQGLLKTTDNGALTATAKAMTDGLGNSSNMLMGTTSTNFQSGTVDFTGATVTGLPSGSFESPLSPARQYQTTSNNKWNFAMPQDGNNYDGGGLESLIDVSNQRRFFCQIYSDTVTDFAILVGDGYTGSLRVELFDVWPTTGMPKSVVASTTSFTAGASGAGLTWYTGGFSAQQTLNYEPYYIAITGIDADADIYCSLRASGYINRLVEINPAAHPSSTNDAIEYIGGGFNSTGTVPFAEDASFGYRIDAFHAILMKQ